MNANVIPFDISEQYKLVLFNRKAKPEDDPNKAYPLMTGSIESKHRKLSVSAYFATDKDTGAAQVDRNGNKFLSLSISLDENRENVIYGKLFRVAKIGVEGQYSGFFSHSEFVDGVWIERWNMPINGKRKVSGDEKYVYISCDVRPAQVPELDVKSAQGEQGSSESKPKPKIEDVAF